MCGITGFVDFNLQFSKLNNGNTIKKMNNQIRYRGPDGTDIWQSLDGKINLGHVRLSIVELSENGKQPMISNSGRYVIIFNGEIYNYQEIKKTLHNKYKFKGNSDTEVILASIEIFGIDNTLEHITGMFALAIYDNLDNKIYLIRDRMGEKPLYFGYLKSNFVFASELKAFKNHPYFEGELSTKAINNYFKYGYIPSPDSIYEGIYKLPPASVLVLDINANTTFQKKYWKVEQESNKHIFDYSNETSVLNHLEHLIINSVKRQITTSDVPVGAFLSGGIDSSLIASVMQSISNSSINTFSIGFAEKEYNEAEDARNIANYLGTNHTEFFVTPKECEEVIPLLPRIYDEPFSDSSQIPMYLLSKLTRQNVTVALSGDGGDELFNGYERYKIMKKIISFQNSLPKILNRELGSALKGVGKWKGIFNIISPKKIDHIIRLGEVLSQSNTKNSYDIFLQGGSSGDILKNNNSESKSFVLSNSSQDFFESYTYEEWMSYIDMNMYLPDDILVKVDRATMSNSLESRVPFLDKEIVEFAINMPLNYKNRNGCQKWILKELLKRRIPTKYVEKPKSGFNVPIGEWLRNPLREWAEDLLNPDRINKEGILNANVVENIWKNHLDGRRNKASELWRILMFQIWIAEQKK